MARIHRQFCRAGHGSGNSLVLILSNFSEQVALIEEPLVDFGLEARTSWCSILVLRPGPGERTWKGSRLILDVLEEKRRRRHDMD
jgi:hypothetical protein